MLKKLKNFFSKKKTIHTTTGETVNIPVAELHPTLVKMNKGSLVTLMDINLYLSDVLDASAIPPGVYKFHSVLLEQGTFLIERFVYNEETKHIYVILTEEAFNLPITVSIDAKRFSEVFKSQLHHLSSMQET